MLASTVETLNLGGATAINVDIDAADISTETVTNTNTAGAALTFSTAGTADVTNVASDITMRLGADFDITTLTVNDGTVIALDAEVDQTAGTAAVILGHTTAATTTTNNTMTLTTTDSNTANGDTYSCRWSNVYRCK